jgi:hypothetical protein
MPQSKGESQKQKSGTGNNSLGVSHLHPQWQFDQAKQYLLQNFIF